MSTFFNGTPTGSHGYHGLNAVGHGAARAPALGPNLAPSAGRGRGAHSPPHAAPRKLFWGDERFEQPRGKGKNWISFITYFCGVSSP